MVSRISYHPNKTSQISHELRIPLAGIMGMADCLSHTNLTLEQKGYVATIEAQVNRLLSLENKLHAFIKGRK